MLRIIIMVNIVKFVVLLNFVLKKYVNWLFMNVKKEFNIF